MGPLAERRNPGLGVLGLLTGSLLAAGVIVAVVRGGDDSSTRAAARPARSPQVTTTRRAGVATTTRPRGVATTGPTEPTPTSNPPAAPSVPPTGDDPAPTSASGDEGVRASDESLADTGGAAPLLPAVALLLTGAALRRRGRR